MSFKREGLGRVDVSDDESLEEDGTSPRETSAPAAVRSDCEVRVWLCDCGRIHVETQHYRRSFSPAEFLGLLRRAAELERRRGFTTSPHHGQQPRRRPVISSN